MKFPSIAVSEAEKQKKTYYESWVKAIVSNTFTKNWIVDYNKLAILNTFYKEGTGSDLTGYLQTAPDGSAMPGIWLSINTVFTRLQSLIGELEERGYMIKARALNNEAVARKLEEKERLRVKRITQELRQYVEQETGIQLEAQEYIPQTEDELSEYMDLSWKDKNVSIIEAILKWVAQRNDWDEERKALLTDILRNGICVVRNDIKDSVPVSPRIDPLHFILDPHTKKENCSDSTYFGEAEYMPLAAAAERYGLTEEELDEAQQFYQTYLGQGLEHTVRHYYDCMPGQHLRWFKQEDGLPRCLVIRACWRDFKVITHKDEVNDKGTFFQEIDPNDFVKKKDKDKIVSNKLECWRQGTIIGGKFLKEYGECANQPRELGSLQKSEAPYTVWKLHNDAPLVERLMGPQVLKDIALYQLQIQTARAIGKVLIFDEAAMPQGMTKESVGRYIKADGIAWINSKEYQLGSQTNLFQAVDVSLSDSITQSINLIDYYDRQLDQISGVGPERQGQVTAASQAVGVTNSAIFQSNLITAPLFRGFERFCSRVLNYQAKLAKISWANKEVFAPIIGTTGIDFLRDNIDISLDEFDVIIQSLPPTTLERQKLEQMLMIAVQSDPTFIMDALDIFLEQDTTVAVKRFKRKMAIRQIQQQQQAQQQSQQEQANQQAQMKLQAQQQQGNWDNQLQLQQMKDESGMKKTLVTGRVHLNKAKLDLLK
jgi:hypothetical protein